MGRRSSTPLPRVERVLAELGQNVRLARARRRLSAELVAERAGMSRPTLRAIERGDAGVTLGALANVLDTLGMVDDLALVARADQLGHQLQDARVQATQRVRTSRRKDDREERVLERLADPRGDASSRTTRKTIL